LTNCASREVREETGLQIRITGLIGTYTDPHILIAYSDGEVRQEFTFVYAAEIESGELKIDDESKEATWVPLLVTKDGQGMPKIFLSHPATVN
jgi:8-oxo-dGTP diphosphatase